MVNLISFFALAISFLGFSGGVFASGCNTAERSEDFLSFGVSWLGSNDLSDSCESSSAYHTDIYLDQQQPDHEFRDTAVHRLVEQNILNEPSLEMMGRKVLPSADALERRLELPRLKGYNNLKGSGTDR